MVSTKDTKFDHLSSNSTNLEFQKRCIKTNPFPIYTWGKDPQLQEYVLERPKLKLLVTEKYNIILCERHLQLINDLLNFKNYYIFT